MGGVQIYDADHGFAAIVTKRLNSVRGQVDVGVDDRPHEPSGVPTDEIGACHEFGLGHMPQRSFLRAWVDESHLIIREKLNALLLETIIYGKDWRAPFGQWVVDRLRQKIWLVIPPPLQDATLERKGDAPPLVDTGQLVNAIIDQLETI
jgi:hypothetical protein